MAIFGYTQTMLLFFSFSATIFDAVATFYFSKKFAHCFMITSSVENSKLGYNDKMAAKI